MARELRTHFRFSLAHHFPPLTIFSVLLNNRCFLLERSLKEAERFNLFGFDRMIAGFFSWKLRKARNDVKTTTKKRVHCAY